MARLLQALLVLEKQLTALGCKSIYGCLGETHGLSTSTGEGSCVRNELDCVGPTAVPILSPWMVGWV